MVQSIELFHLTERLRELEAFPELVPAVLLTAHLLLELGLYLPQPVLFAHQISVTIRQIIIQLPLRLFLSQSLFHFLFLQVFPLHLFPLLLRKLDFLNFGRFLGTDPLILHCGTFVAEFGHEVP